MAMLIWTSSPASVGIKNEDGIIRVWKDADGTLTEKTAAKKIAAIMEGTKDGQQFDRWSFYVAGLSEDYFRKNPESKTLPKHVLEAGLKVDHEIHLVVARYHPALWIIPKVKLISPKGKTVKATPKTVTF